MYKSSLFFTSLIILLQACASKGQQNEKSVKNELDFDLRNEIAQMAEVDQTAAWIPQGEFKNYSQEEWRAYKDSVFTSNKKRAEEIFNEHGFPGFDLVGEQGSHDFWLIVQHCDFDPEFQMKVLTDMKLKMENNQADKSNYAYLIDRVNKNLGEKIIYGTQVTYNKMGQAVSRPLIDSANVDIRRAEVGLEPLVEYLNRMTQSHWEMNKENMLKRGITEPMLYSSEK